MCLLQAILPTRTAHGFRLQRVVGPIVLGVAPAHILAHLKVTRGLEAAQVARNLDGAVAGGEQMHSKRNLPPRHPRGVQQPKYFLQTHRQYRRIGVAIINADTGAGGYFQMSWC